MIHLEKAKSLEEHCLWVPAWRVGWLWGHLDESLRQLSDQGLAGLPPLAVLFRVLMQSPLPAAWRCHKQPPPHPTWSCSTTQGSGTWAATSVLTRSSQEPGVPARGHRWEAGGRCHQRFPHRVSLHQVTKSLQQPSPDRKQTPLCQALSSDWSHWSEIQIPAVTRRITSTWGVLMGSLLSRPAPGPGSASHTPPGRASTNTNLCPRRKCLWLGYFKNFFMKKRKYRNCAAFYKKKNLKNSSCFALEWNEDK